MGLPEELWAHMHGVEDLKNQGNACVKSGSYGEAVLHYSHAVKLEPSNHLLYSNRSLAFLKLQQYYLALEDAKQAIKLQPNWPKGFFRKGEVEYQTGNCASAIMSYKQALLLDPSNAEIQESLDRAQREATKLRKEKKISDTNINNTVATLCSKLSFSPLRYVCEFAFTRYINYAGQLCPFCRAHNSGKRDIAVTFATVAMGASVSAASTVSMSQGPWIFSGVGFVIGLCIVLADQYLTKEPSLKYIIVQLTLLAVFGGLGFLCWKGYRYLQDSHRATLLEAPIDLIEELGSKSEEETDTDKTPENKPRKKGGIGAARQRYKQGKS